MPDEDDGLTNSQRKLFRATYTPLSVPAVRGSGDLLMKGAFLRFLGLSEEEAREFSERQPAAKSVRTLSTAQTEQEYTGAIRDLVEIEPNALATLSRGVAKRREEEWRRLARRIVSLDQKYLTAAAREDRPNRRAASPEPEPDRRAAAESRTAGGKRAPALVERGADEMLLPPTRIVEVATPTVRGETARANPGTEMMELSRPATSVHPLISEIVGSAVAERLPKVLEWAIANRRPEVAELAADWNVPLAGSGEEGNVDEMLVAANIILPDKVRRHLIAKRVSELIAKRVFDLVGLLHLERLVMTPREVERGELLYSLPLAPRETVTLSHKEWAIREEEYSRYIQDYLENYSETGVAQSTELAKSTVTQSQRQDATSANLMSMSAQPVTQTSSVNAAGGAVVNAPNSIEETVAQTKTVTTKAASRTIQDHKVSFTVTTVRGTEDWTSRLLRNRHANKSMIVDYYRRMRRWRNELYRYGVRLTYDIVVPHPGRRVLARYDRLRQIEAEMAKGFQPTYGPNSIGVNGWKGLMNVFKVPLPPPPTDQTIEDMRTLRYTAPGDNTEELMLTVPPGYRLQTVGWEVSASSWDAERGAVVFVGPSVINSMTNSSSYGFYSGPQNVQLGGLPVQGPVKGVFFLRRLGVGTVRLYAKVTATDELLQEWKKQCWGIIREAELVRYQEKLDALRAERLNLQRAIDAADSLSLRRIEREHIMLACLEWLFPFLNLKAGWFDNFSDTPTDFDRIMGLQASVLIKLMHTAIDWDTMLVTLLPFFWERIDSQAVVFVDHADPLHREFLRAGAARVVLPIRPGYEEEILSLFDLGLVSSISDSHRYKQIVDEVTAANADYQSKTHPADATLTDGSIDPAYEDDYPLENGKLIGRWHETMPTGALDMQVHLYDVIEH
jgi:hypothetical protein